MIEMADNAYAAKLWANGKRQIEIAEMLGMNSPSPISSGIREFLLAYSPAFRADPWNTTDRPGFVAGALKAFEKKHGAVPDGFSKTVNYVAYADTPHPTLVDHATKLTVEQRMDLSLKELPLSVRLENCLIKGNDFKCVKDLYTMSERTLMQTPNFGKVTLKEVRALLQRLDLPPMQEDNDEEEEQPSRSNGDATHNPRASVLELLDEIEQRVIRIEAILTATLRELRERD